MQLWHQPFCIFSEDRRPVQISKAISEALRSGHILDPQKDVIVLGVADLMGRELASEPLVPIEIDLNLQGNPGLNSHMDQAKVAIHEIEVQVQAFAPGRLNEHPALSEAQ